MTETNFYHFMEKLDDKFASVAKDLEESIFVSPRTMLTHARALVETLLVSVMKTEKLETASWVTLKERLDTLDEKGYLTKEVREALHHVRMLGNQASHDPRAFRFSEALLSWESIYIIVKWYVEVYGPTNFEVPPYHDPVIQKGNNYDLSELEERLKEVEELLKATVRDAQKEKQSEEDAPLQIEEPTKEEIKRNKELEQPGYTTIRTIAYKDQVLAIPYFLRDAFLLPQRFSRSETFLIRLGAEQQARIMSELPASLEGLNKHVKRFNEASDETFFAELGNYIEEEKARRKISIERSGELFLYYKADYIIVTEALKEVSLNKEQFSGIPSLIKQLQRDSILVVGQLPKELVILAKYNNVGIGTVENLFKQLKNKHSFRENSLV